MLKVDRSELLPIGEYENIREHFRRRIIAEKQHRRASVGPHISVTFENHDTVLLQIQEMLRTERITKEAAIQHELDTYNELVPGPAQLSMTLFVEIPEQAERDRMLVALAGLESSVFLEVDGVLVAAHSSERDGAEPGRTTAVHYFLVELPADQAASLAGREPPVALVVDHPAYRHRADLPPNVVAQLAGDLA
ncbi:MAG: DUF3501 family protein [Myxococcales bacterium]|nr:DUF3501 family protein [Myxococcales bacterium]